MAGGMEGLGWTDEALHAETQDKRKDGHRPDDNGAFAQSNTPMGATGGGTHAATTVGSVHHRVGRGG